MNMECLGFGQVVEGTQKRRHGKSTRFCRRQEAHSFKCITDVLWTTQKNLQFAVLQLRETSSLEIQIWKFFSILMRIRAIGVDETTQEERMDREPPKGQKTAHHPLWNIGIRRRLSRD